jgi:hypothetical protein
MLVRHLCDHYILLFFTPENTMDTQDFLQRQMKAQAPLHNGEDFCSEAAGIAKRREQLWEDISGKSDAAIALEAIGNYMKVCAARGELTKPAVNLANVAIESISQNAGVDYTPMRFATEADAPESENNGHSVLKHAVSSLFAVIKENVSKVGEHVLEMLSHFHRQCSRIKSRATDLRSRSAKLVGNHASFPAIKAEKWFRFLCYTETGFDKGLNKVMKHVHEFVQAHEKMSSACIDKYVKWLKDNGKSGDDALENLRSHPDDFLMPNMHIFNRSLQWRTPKGANVFFRSEELPGGHALFVETYPGERGGADALKALEQTRYDFHIHNPSSYNVFSSNLVAIAAAPFAVWAVVVAPIVGVAIGAGVLAHAASQKEHGTGRELEVHKDMLFEVLTREEINRVIEDTFTSVNAIEQWYNSVLQKPWKSHDLDNAINEITKAEGAGAGIKSYCNALLHLVSTISTGLEHYAFDFYHACLLFAEKSLKQYV